MEDKTCVSCKTSDVVWGVVSGEGSGVKVHRLTFSRSLAQLLVGYDRSRYRVQAFRYVLGDVVHDGDGWSGLTALVSCRNDVVLRISLLPGLSRLHADGASRYLRKAYLHTT
jgi:hypothetical protein